MKDNAQHLQDNLLLLIGGNTDHKQDDALKEALGNLGNLINMCDDPDYHSAYGTAVKTFEDSL